MNAFLKFIKSNKGNFFINVTVIIGMTILALYLGINSLFTANDIPHKSDAEMIKNFKDHRDEFQKLLKMIQEDRELKRVDKDWTIPEIPQTLDISNERIKEYRELFTKAGTPRGFYSYLPNSVMFISSSQGLAVSGSSKSYMIFLNGAPTNTVNNTDDYCSKGSLEAERKECKFPVFRHVEDNWFIRFDAN